jgi:predicted transcriptional regulator
LEVAVAGSTQNAVTVIGSRVPIELAERVRRAAEAEDRTISNFIKRAVQHEVQRADADTIAAA